MLALSDGTYDKDLGFETAKKLIETEMKRSEEQHTLEYTLSQKQAAYDKLVGQGKEQTAVGSLSDEIQKLETQMDELFTNIAQYPTEKIFQKIEMIESENILMYKLGPETYEQYVDAKNTLENAIKENYWNEKPYDEKIQSFPLASVQINPDSKNLEVTLHKDVMHDDDAKIYQYESIIENIVPDDVPWTLAISDD